MKNIALATAVAAALTAVAIPGSADAQTFGVRVRALSIMPQVSSSPLPGIDVSSEWTPELNLSYFFSPNLAAELILATQRHTVSLNGARLGTLKHLPPTVTLQYHFNPGGTIQPYAGVGINYTRFYDISLAGGLTVDRASWGPALQVGVDYRLNGNWFLNLDVKKIWMGTDVMSAAGAHVTALDINPVIVGVGIGRRF